MQDDVAKMIINRLDSIEGNMQEMRTALISLARVEERQATNGAAVERLESRLDSNVREIHARIRPLERLRWLGIGVATGAGAGAGALSSVIPWTAVLA